MRHTIITAVVALMAFITAQAQTAIEIVYSGASASVSIPAGVAGVTAAVNGANVTILSTTTTNEYVYRVRGQSPDGSLLISGSYKLQLQLAGLDLTNAHGGAAIDVECGKRIAVELMAGTQNSLADAAGTQKGAFYFKGHAEFEGSGTLSVTGRAKHAICAKEYIELKSSTGTINVLGAVSDGIHCGKGKVNNENNYFKMNGGVVNIANIGGDGIDSDDYGTILIKGGSLNVNVSGTDADGLKADSTLTLEGGTVNINVTGQESNALRCCWNAYLNGGTLDITAVADGSKGIKGKQQTAKTVNGGGSVYLAGTDINILCSGDYTVTDGDTTKCMGISVDADLYHTAGNVSIQACGQQARTYNVKGTESLSPTFHTYWCPMKFNPYAWQYSMTAYAQLTVDGLQADLTDYTLVACVGDECRGTATVATADDGTQYAELRIYSNTASGESISFRAYDADGNPQACNETVTFGSDSLSGTPGSPLSLTAGTASATPGDMDGDGQLTVSDITLLIDTYLNSNYTAQGDMDGDGEITVSDITQLIAAYLE